MSNTDFIQTDILIIGSGLAGLKCGISALEKNPEASVLIVTKGGGPVGSSFTNINNALGMQICLTDKEKELFVEKAKSISSPGLIEPRLTEIMAEDSERCMHFLDEHAIQFNRTATGKPIRYPGCFHKEINGAVIFNNLANAFQQLHKKYLSLSGKYIENHSLIHLLNRISKDETAICGGIFFSDATGSYTVVNSRSTILASGGTTPLFEWNVGGLSLSGYSPAILKNAGAQIINPEFHQFIWHHPTTYQPIYPLNLIRSGASIRTAEETIDKVPNKILSLLSERETHVPAAYNFRDTAIEKYLLSFADKQGIVTFVLQNKKEVPAVLCAHAWNGGAKVDENGWTGVPGLYACGECAGGMHGANRIGGAMVLATQVFGRKAGIKAAQTYSIYNRYNEKTCIERAAPFINSISNCAGKKFLNELKHQVYDAAINFLCGNKIFRNINPKDIVASIDNDNTIDRLLLQSALIVSPGLKSDSR